MFAMRAVYLGSLIVAAQSTRLQVVGQSEIRVSSSTTLEDNQYILTWSNRMGAQAGEAQKKYGEFVVPVKCSDKAVWLKVGEGAEKDRHLALHCVLVTCESTGEVVTEILSSCPWGYGQDPTGNRIMPLGDAYFMRVGDYRSFRNKNSDHGFTAVMPDTNFVGGHAEKEDGKDRGWEVSPETILTHYDFRHWVTNLDCKTKLEVDNIHKLTLPRDPESTETCKKEADEKHDACNKEAESLIGKSAWWFKFVHFGVKGNSYGGTWSGVTQKYSVCAEFSKEATDSKYRDRSKDTRAEHSSFALFGQSWQYQCEEALDKDVAKKSHSCSSRSWWCEADDVKACMGETYLPQKPE